METPHLIYEIRNEFTDYTAPSENYLLSEYNSLIKRLLLMLPESDGVLTAVPENGIIETDLSAAQVRRVLCEDSELLRASETLFALLPSGRLFCPREKSIAVSVDKECKIFYRTLPKDVEKDTLSTAVFPLDKKYIPLVRAWMWYKTYLYVGDFDSAKPYYEEYERLMALYRDENGVKE